jgi:hypothetical protein
MNITYRNSIIISFLLVLTANLLSIIITSPPDGRIKYELVASSFLVILYFILFNFISSILKNKRKSITVLVLNTLLAFYLGIIGVSSPIILPRFNLWGFFPTAGYLLLFSFFLLINILITIVDNKD